jgi:signal peptidase I
MPDHEDQRPADVPQTPPTPDLDVHVPPSHGALPEGLETGAGDTPHPIADAFLPVANEPTAPLTVSSWPPPSSVSDVAVPPAVTAVTVAVLRRELVAWFKTLFSAAIYATLIVTFGFQVARVEGESMAPTLANQDRLIVNKIAYRFGPPRKGDIVMLFYPRDPDKSFVKRVIAEEGETVKIENGRVFVNDVPMQDDYVLPGFRSHEDQAAKIIAPGYYFVMGDHRNNSFDSRAWGEVPKRYIVGRVQLRWWPIPHARLF